MGGAGRVDLEGPDPGLVDAERGAEGSEAGNGRTGKLGGGLMFVLVLLLFWPDGPEGRMGELCCGGRFCIGMFGA